MDEATPHMHVNFVPVADGKVCYVDLFTEKPQKSRRRKGGQLTALHDDFLKHNQNKGYQLQRGEIQTVDGKKELLSVLDFKVQQRAVEMQEKKNVVFLGTPGVGKTHLAVALGMVAASHRYFTYYIHSFN